MVSLPYAMMYTTQKHASNLTYPAAPSAWYSNYPPHHPTHHPNNQFLNAAQSAIGAGANGILDSDSAAASNYYNAHHHHMLHSSSPDWVHDNYNLSTTNSQFFTNGMTPPTSLHLSPTLQSHHTTSSSGGVTTGNEHLSNGLQNIPPSPPITVNSACSEMSSPGIGSNGNGGGGGSGGGVIGSGDVSPNLSSNTDLSRTKSPYGWLKKTSYQNQPNTGKTRTKDKYRVVYTDYQRCELEKEFHMAQYITIRRKTELAQALQLSERQVKIWFQNRRAKNRKLLKKRDVPISGGGGVSSSLLSNSCANVGLSLSHHHHHQMGNGHSASAMASAMYGLDIKPKLEPGLGSGHLSHGYGHLHHQSHSPMHHLSTMGMNFLHHSTASALPPSIPSPITSIPSQAHLSS